MKLKVIIVFGNNCFLSVSKYTLVNLLETIKYLKFEIRDPEYDAQARKHKTVFYYIVSLNKENK